jgi:hypothetical protein
VERQLDEAPNQEDLQGCDILTIPLEKIKGICRHMQGRETVRVEAMLRKICRKHPAIRFEARDLNTLSFLMDEAPRYIDEDVYISLLLEPSPTLPREL